MADLEYIKQLVANPTESLNVELKGWIDLSDPESKAKVIKFSLAARNFGGGFMLFGFDDKTSRPIAEGRPLDVRSAYHIDQIQSLVAKYSSEPFEVKMHFVEQGGLEFPVLEVPSDVRTPVAAKASFNPNGNKDLIRQGAVYVRTLSSNTTSSSAEAGWGDWKQILDVCFDNREADIGRFVRRHLSGVTPESLQEILGALGGVANNRSTTGEAITAALSEGLRRFNEVVKERKISLPTHGSYEAAVVLPKSITGHDADQAFLSRLLLANPRYTGWPAWIDGRSAADPLMKPYLAKGVWEEAAFFLGQGADHIDFWRLDPAGAFYLYRALPEDVSPAEYKPEPLTFLDSTLPIVRVAEIIAVALQFAKELQRGGIQPNNVNPGGGDELKLSFGFRWTGLRSRELKSWARPQMLLFSDNWRAYDDEVRSDVEVPLDIPLSALAGYVYAAVKPLFSIFNGFKASPSIIEDLVTMLLDRRL